MSKKILGIGNAIVDVFVKVDDNFLAKNKLVKGSMKLIEKNEFESLKNTIKIEKIEAGGSVANTMAGIAYLGGNSSLRHSHSLVKHTAVLVASVLQATWGAILAELVTH